MLSFDRVAGSRLAAQLGFYLLMTFPALLLIAVWILSNVFDSAEVRSDLIHEIIGALPLDAVEGRKEIEDLLDGLTKGAGSLGIVTVALLVYSGSGAIGAVRHAVETAQPDGAEGPSFPRSKAFDVGVTVVTLPVVLLIAGLALSRDISSLVESSPLLEGIARIAGGGPAFLVVGVLLLTWLYWVQNPGERTWSSAAVGGLAATGICWLIWLGLGIWFGITGGSSAVYGVLAGFVGLMLFLHLACVGVVLGAHLAASFAAYRRRLG